jgi:hypothetical protein
MKKGVNTLTFVFGYAVFLFFISYMTVNAAASGFAANNNPSTTNTTFSNVTGSYVQIGFNAAPVAPVCTFGHIGIDGLFGCAINYISAFIGLTMVSSSLAALNLMVFSPLIVGMLWALALLIRGGAS